MRLRGSMVLEAAIIFPMIVIIIFAIVFFAYYKHDMVVLKSGMRTDLMRTVAENDAAYLKRDKNDFGLFYLGIDNVSANYDGKEGKISVRADIERFPFISGHIDENAVNEGLKESRKVYMPQETLRRLKALEEFIDR